VLDNDSDLGTYYFAVGAAARNGAVNTYFIKDVNLVATDGTTKYPATPFFDDKGYFGDDHPDKTPAPSISGTGANPVIVYLKDMAFAAADVATSLTRSLAYEP